ncbi:hypothetical protein pdam_00016270 [Pocillopora damicornis]|uniref:Peptidase S1 domain-containing protein n=1 Tax=Pocillopora damicornis TaxID=46731 RepID=A0A3M6TAU4_POCDA|nr:hypothetical protein pdam_00016270 [Pocillopora damicornis]
MPTSSTDFSTGTMCTVSGKIRSGGQQSSIMPNVLLQATSQKKVISHSQYNKRTKDNDITLVELSQEVEFSDNIKPICMPTSSTDFSTGTMCTVSGFGTIRSGGPQSSHGKSSKDKRYLKFLRIFHLSAFAMQHTFEIADPSTTGCD